MNEWNIQSRAHACETCGHPFVDRQTYHTLLFDERASLGDDGQPTEVFDDRPTELLDEQPTEAVDAPVLPSAPWEQR